MAHKAEADDEALSWAVRTADPAFSDWEAFQLWLETDPANAPRYHALCDDVAVMSDLLDQNPAPTLAPGRHEPRPARRIPARWIGGAIAACAVGSVGFLALDRQPQPMAIETRPGVTRTIALADGSSIALNGDTRIVLDRKNARTATLDRGEALFSVRHDAARLFHVSVGDNRIVDLGTQFSVARDKDVTRVAVSEGEVAFNPDAGNVRLRPGQALTLSEREKRVVVTTVAVEAVGAWRNRQLIYAGTPLGSVAADLSRSLGVTLVPTPEVAARPFRGTIALTGLDKDPAALGPLLDVTIRRSGTVWTMTARP